MKDALYFSIKASEKKAGEDKDDKVNNIYQYNQLNDIPQWRRMLSTFWSQDPFRFQSHTFQSYEHAYQFIKFTICGFHDVAYLFAQESKTRLSRSTGNEAHKKGKEKNIPLPLLKRWQREKEFFKQELNKAKYTPNTNPGNVLINTKDANLYNKDQKIPQRYIQLEKLRKKLQNT